MRIGACDASAGSDRPLVIWEGSQAAFHSFARCNVSYCNALLDRGAVDLRLVSNERHWAGLDVRPELARLRPLDAAVAGLPIREARQRPALWVRHGYPPRPNSPGGFPWVIVQPWEYSLLPTAMVEIFNRCTEVWAPSRFCAEVVRRSGVWAPLEVVPYGVETRVFRPDGDLAPLESARAFRFLFVGASIYRKGVDILASAFVRAFHPDDDVTLVVKDVDAGSVYEGHTAAAHLQRLAADPTMPSVLHIERILGDAELVGLYRACDVFVSSYRGEGFSLPTLEAMACGLPVIVTAGGATDDFVDEEVGWRIPSRLRSVGHAVNGLETPGEAFLHEPDVEALAALLREAYDNRAEVARRGRAAARRAREQWSWQQAADRIAERAIVLAAPIRATYSS